MRSRRIDRARDLTTLLVAGLLYWLRIHPRARREIRRWYGVALRIPDPVLRAHALHKLTRERLNPEAAAFFAILAPRRRRGPLIRLIVAYQIMYDYLDAINEDPASAGLSNGLQLHSALIDAVRSRQPGSDYYKHHPQHDDGGYLAELVRACRSSLQQLPSTPLVEPLFITAAERCGEAQSRNHAALVEGEAQLVDWSRRSSARAGYLWWELAAAGISCLAIHALFAAAAANFADGEARLVDRAYFPAVCAISALLDSLVDHPHDLRSENHSFVGHYSNSTLAGTRMTSIIGEAKTLLAPLANRRRHTLILAGIASFYLSSPEALDDFASSATHRIVDCLGRGAHPVLLVMRLRRAVR